MMNMSDSHMEVKVLGQLHAEGDEVISEGEAIPDTTDMRHSTNMMTEVCVYKALTFLYQSLFLLQLRLISGLIPNHISEIGKYR